MPLVTEANHGLAYDRDVNVSFETLNGVTSVAMTTKTLLKHTLKSQFFGDLYFFKAFLKVGNIVHFLCQFEKILWCRNQDKGKKALLRFKKLHTTDFLKNIFNVR